jgi:hypothetical protein
MLSEDTSAVAVDLAEFNGVESGTLESERESADSGKEVDDTH